MGKAMAAALLQRGCDVLIVARRRVLLEEAAKDLEHAKIRPSQAIDIDSGDLSNAQDAERIVKQAARIPDIVMCCAGSCTPGLFADLTAEQVSSGVQSNYLTALHLAHAAMKPMLSKANTSHIVFVSSVLAFMGQTAYSSYAPSKAALRSLADTLRQELLLYGDRVKVHCAFPASILGEALDEEKRTRPEIVNTLEESDAGQAPETVCAKVLDGLDRGYFLIETEFNGSLLRNGMRGPSPRNNVLWDFGMEVAAFFAWPFVRYDFDKKVKAYGKKKI